MPGPARADVVCRAEIISEMILNSSANIQISQHSVNNFYSFFASLFLLLFQVSVTVTGFSEEADTSSASADTECDCTAFLNVLFQEVNVFCSSKDNSFKV